MTSVSDIKQLMENAKKEIEQRKKVLNPVSEERLSAIQALQAKIAAKMGSLGSKGIMPQLTAEQIQAAQAAEERDRSLNVYIDSEGRTIDRRTGEVVLIQSRTPTLKANLRVQQRELKNAEKKSESAANAAAAAAPAAEAQQPFIFTKTQKAPAVDEEEKSTDTTSAFFDNRLRFKPNIRNKRKLAFVEKGKFQDLAKKLRDKAKIELLKQEINQRSKKTGISSESKLALIQPKRYQKDSNVPEIEWWDFAVLNEPNYDTAEGLTESEFIMKLNLTNLIEHPIQMKPPTLSDKKIVPTVWLTKQERKKMRRQNRTEKMKEEQEKIRLGLMPPPEPKVKISNLMRVLGTEAVQDPTKIEEYVRNQMAKRQKMHEEANAARKLTPEQRATKKSKKLSENTAYGVNVSLYRIRDVNDPSTKFKLEANCNQLHMTGVVVMCRYLNIVVVEGGPKQQSKFRRLMMSRIKWSEVKSKKPFADEDEDSEERKEKNSCKLVWEGLVKQRSFGNIIFKSCPTTAFAREYFKKFNVEHYWDIAQSDAIIEMSEN